MEDEIRELFSNDGFYPIEVNIRKAPKGIYIEVTDMYDPPEMKGTLLATLQAISRITGMEEVNDYGDVSERGCETCDYGSRYGFEFFAFSPKTEGHEAP